MSDTVLPLLLFDLGLVLDLRPLGTASKLNELALLLPRPVLVGPLPDLSYGLPALLLPGLRRITVRSCVPPGPNC
jgi:hypothetical protein